METQGTVRVSFVSDIMAHRPAAVVGRGSRSVVSEAAAGPARGEPEVRQRILRAAETLFLTHGFSRITMDELAGELGMSKKTLYAHFAGKEDLFRAVADRFVGELRADLTAIVADECLTTPSTSDGA
jgi:AcrR family transcriptional regulator